ncbi:MAG: HAMP domain-containing sensor histidine kinase [Bacteroidota bacterium]|nr:HAMP domain-containing sensor histidine kinase [Bacteroidota bacterium]
MKLKSVLQYIYASLIGSAVILLIAVIVKLLSGSELFTVELIYFAVAGALLGGVNGYLTARLKKISLKLREINKKNDLQKKQLDVNLSALKEIERKYQVAKHEAQESERLKSSFLSNLSHEIRTPMNGILGFSQILETPGLTASEQKEYLGHINVSTGRLLEIVENIVEMSKIESGSITINISKADVNQVVKRVYNSFESKSAQKHLKFRISEELDYAKAYAYGDFEKISKVLEHLVSNSIKFTFDGFIEIGVRRKKSYLEFFVKDTGIGIDAGQHDKIFNRFDKQEDHSATDYGGTGLGLPISKAYVELIGGMIDFKSNQSEGSTFFFIVPYDRASV